MTTTAYMIGEAAGNCGLTPKFIDVDGIRTRYYEVGSGEPMVLCHGAGWAGSSSANTWAPVLAGLGQRFHVFAADKLASGMTDNPESDDDYTIEAQINHMYRFIRTVGLDRVHLVGQSRGGYMATRLTLEHPEMARTLVVVDSATTAPDAPDFAERRRKLFANQPSDPRERIRFRQGQLSYNKEHITDEFVEAAVYMDSLPKAQQTRQRWENGGEELFNSTLARQKRQTHEWIREGRLQVPTLLYWGKNDPSAILAVGLALFEMMCEKNRRTRMLIANQAGHFHYREYPEEWVRNVTNFVTGW